MSTTKTIGKQNRHLPLVERFWAQVKKCIFPRPGKEHLGPCWEWTGTLTDKGYGNIQDGGETVGCHKLALEWRLRRKLRKGMQALHKCANRKCVRDSHLYEGTAKQNAEDRERDRRLVE